MNTDIRLSVGFWQHPKTKKTAKRLGLEGVRSLQVLWMWAATNRPEGNLSGMDWEDIELAADWQGDDRAFFDLCLGMWIDETDTGYVLHDWKEHNAWASQVEDRNDTSRLSRLSQVNRAAFEKLKAAGFIGINKDDYERVKKDGFSAVGDILANAGERPGGAMANAGGALAPAPDPNPALKQEERDDTSPSLVLASKPTASRQKKAEPPKTSYGEYQRVKLTADECARLDDKFGADALAAAITKLDLYIEAKGKDEYKCHAAALQKWVFAAVEQDRQRGRASPASPSPPSDPVQDAAKAEAVQKAVQRVQDEAQRRAMEFLEKGKTA